MWKLIKTDFEYSKNVLIFIHLIMFAVWIPFVVQGWKEMNNSYPALQAALVAATAILFLFRFVRVQKEKRERQNFLLPISTGKLAVSRLLLIGLFWLEVTVLMALAFLLHPSIYRHEFVFGFLSLSGYMIAMNAAPFIFRDLRHSLFSKRQIYWLSIGWTVAAFFGYAIFMLFVFSSNGMTLLPESFKLLKADFSGFIAGPTGAAIISLIGFSLSGVSVVLFKRRKMYTE